MVLTTAQKAILVAGSTIAMSPVILWGAALWTLGLGFAALVGFGVAAALAMGRNNRG